MNPLKRLAITVAYITCIPLAPTPATGRSDEELNGLAKFLPTVGLLIGAILLVVALLLQKAQANNLLFSALMTLTWLIITGGIHFDGLMDTADGIFSHRDRKRMIEIMADSRVGNFGALTGFSLLLLKFACLASLSFPVMLPALLLSPAWARWCETFTIGAFPYLKDQGKGKVWHDTIRFPHDLLIAGILPASITFLLVILGSPLSLIVTASTIGAGLITSFHLNSILKGQTGDTYGAVVECSEAAGLVIFTVVAKHLSLNGIS